MRATLWRSILTCFSCALKILFFGRMAYGVCGVMWREVKYSQLSTFY